MFEQLTEFTDGFLKTGLPGFDCIVMHDGKCVYRHFNGYSDTVNKIKMNGKERYNIYSCSKPITCVAALQLWEQGKFSLEDKLCDYMPEFSKMTVKTENGIKKAERPILIKHLFEMTAGFTYDLNSPSLEKLKAETNGKCPTREAMKYLAKEPLDFEPGEKWQYSLCHDVLAALTEVISGMKFYDYVKLNIFDRLGMHRTTFMLPDDELDTMSGQYIFYNEKNHADKVENGILWYKLGSEYASGGAGGISTVEDYIKFLEALRDGETLLKRSTIELMATNRLTEAQMENYWLKEAYGYGLGVRCPKSDGKISDFGWDGAAGSYLAIDISNKITVFHAQHVISSPNGGIRSQVYDYALKELT